MFTWEGGLGVLYLPTDDPRDNITKLKHTGEHRFRRVRDDELLGEEIVFEVDADGKVVRFLRHNTYTKVR